MNYRNLLTGLILFTIISCKKDGGGSLSIKLTSLSATNIQVGEDLLVNFDFTDKGGHPIDTIYIGKTRINQIQTVTQGDSFYISAPGYDGSPKGQMQLDLGYEDFLISAITPPQYGTPPVDYPDSLIFQFVAKDNAGNVSDTVTTGLIIVQRFN
jgi:hypothetical protein